jgi:hypothetical protein
VKEARKVSLDIKLHIRSVAALGDRGSSIEGCVLASQGPAMP